MPRHLAIAPVPTADNPNPKIMPLTGAMTQGQWPLASDATPLLVIVTDQADTMAAQAALIDAYQNWLNSTQAPATEPPAATGSGTGATTPVPNTLAVSSLTGGNIVLPVPAVPGGAVAIPGSSVWGPGVPAGTTIIAQQTGTPGGNGTYTTNNQCTSASAMLNFIPPPTQSPWPIPRDANTLLAIQQDSTAILRTQTALIQQYQDLLNDSQTPPPPIGP